MLNGARVQRHLLKSIIFCTTFFSLDNKKVVVFFALGNSNDLPTFFYWFTCNPKRLFCASLGVIDGLWVCWAAARLRDSRRSFTTPAQTSHHNTHIKLCHQPPKASEHELKLFLKKIHDLSQRKSTRRAQLNEMKKKERNFAASSSQLFFARLQFYMQCTLSINYLTLARSPFITSVMFMLSFTPCLNFRIFSILLFILRACISLPSDHCFNAKINKHKNVFRTIKCVPIFIFTHFAKWIRVANFFHAFAWHTIKKYVWDRNESKQLKEVPRCNWIRRRQILAQLVWCRLVIGAMIQSNEHIQRMWNIKKFASLQRAMDRARAA